MKEKIDAAEMRKLKTNTIIYGALLINAMLALYPLVHFLGNIGLATWGVQMIFAICFSIVVEKQKKKLNIQTYKEISAFFDGVPLDEIEKKRETEKRLLQRVLMGAGSMGIAIVAVILYWLLSWLLRV
ncbi:MAG: hypothetical protein LBI44_02070 [Oscillospiraceae bacterium]|nr:hypothetical protein [Oscillospiraceae bacterium]